MGRARAQRSFFSIYAIFLINLLVYFTQFIHIRYFLFLFHQTSHCAGEWGACRWFFWRMWGLATIFLTQALMDSRKPGWSRRFWFLRTIWVVVFKAKFSFNFTGLSASQFRQNPYFGKGIEILTQLVDYSTRFGVLSEVTHQLRIFNEIQSHQ
jgi:hypothetical protein